MQWKFLRHKNIPVHAECVFSWVRSEVYQWDQDMYDGSIARFERVRFLDGAFVIPILPNGNILLTLQEQPSRDAFISFPGGALDTPDEDPVECARRELLEETGYSGENLEFWFRYDGTSNVMTYTHYFIAHDIMKIAPITPDGGEKIELFEVSFDEFLELSSDIRFHHHWNLLPILYEARIYPHKKEELKKKLYGV